MKQTLFILIAMLAVGLGACDTGSIVIKTRAVLKNGSKFTAYFQFNNSIDTEWSMCPFTDEKGLSVTDGTDYLPLVIHPTGGYNKGKYAWQADGETLNTLHYTADFYKYPWGYYLNQDEIKRVESTDLDSLIYLSEHLPWQFRLNSNWHYLDNKKLSLLKKGICSVTYASEPMSDGIYISTRDSISEEELELYSLDMNFPGSEEKHSYRLSYFNHTIGNRLWLEERNHYFTKFPEDRTRFLLENLYFRKKALDELLPLIERNVIMDNEFKQALRDSILVAKTNMNLLCSYLNSPSSTSQDAMEMLSGLRWITSYDERKILPAGDELWEIAAKIMIPALPNCYESDCSGLDEYNSELDRLAEIGIVVLEGWFP